MKGFYPIISRITVILTGLIWGAISFFWLGYSVLTLGNLIEEPGSLDYEYEGDAMRIYGLGSFYMQCYLPWYYCF